MSLYSLHPLFFIPLFCIVMPSVSCCLTSSFPFFHSLSLQSHHRLLTVFLCTYFLSFHCLLSHSLTPQLNGCIFSIPFFVLSRHCVLSFVGSASSLSYLSPTQSSIPILVPLLYLHVIPFLSLPFIAFLVPAVCESICHTPTHYRFSLVPPPTEQESVSCSTSPFLPSLHHFSTHSIIYFYLQLSTCSTQGTTTPS